VEDVVEDSSNNSLVGGLVDQRYWQEPHACS
jgi:hypothetical protein